MPITYRLEQSLPLYILFTTPGLKLSAFSKVTQSGSPFATCRTRYFKLLGGFGGHISVISGNAGPTLPSVLFPVSATLKVWTEGSFRWQTGAPLKRFKFWKFSKHCNYCKQVPKWNNDVSADVYCQNINKSETWTVVIFIWNGKKGQASKTEERQRERVWVRVGG